MQAINAAEVLRNSSFSFLGQLRLFSLGVAMSTTHRVVLRLLDRDASELMQLGVEQSPITED